MVRDPFVTGVSSGRMHLSLRTLAANDNVPLGATQPPRRADVGVSTRWPLLNHSGALAAALDESTSSLARLAAQDGNDRYATGLTALRTMTSTKSTAMSALPQNTRQMACAALPLPYLAFDTPLLKRFAGIAVAPPAPSTAAGVAAGGDKP